MFVGVNREEETKARSDVDNDSDSQAVIDQTEPILAREMVPVVHFKSPKEGYKPQKCGYKALQYNKRRTNKELEQALYEEMWTYPEPRPNPWQGASSRQVAPIVMHQPSPS